MDKKKQPFARKRFGQHFLADGTVIERIIDQANLTENEHVIEIGPGRGALTRKLLEKGVSLTVIEIDNDLARGLEAEFGNHPQFRLVNDDALKVNWSELIKPGVQNKIIANLPYNISTPLFFRFVAHRTHFSSTTIMVQKEVAQRICHDGKGKKLKDYGILSVISDSVFNAEILFKVPPGCFIPKPKVDSAVLQLKPKEGVLADEDKFFGFVRRAFNLRRKLLMTHLKKYETELFERLSEKDLSYLHGLRAENLSPQQYQNLFYKGRI